MRRSSTAVPVLSISPSEADHEDLARIFDDTSCWTLLRAPGLEAALECFYQEPIPVVLCASDPAACTWQQVIDELLRLPHPPIFILTSPDASAPLWAEALNLGAFDVLVRPFDRREVLHRASAAWSRWVDQHTNASTSAVRPA